MWCGHLLCALDFQSTQQNSAFEDVSPQIDGLKQIIYELPSGRLRVMDYLKKLATIPVVRRLTHSNILVRR
jgi:hypothetical protein